MSRGKFANRAEARVAMNSTSTELERSRLKVRDLISENKAIKAEFEEAKRIHQTRVRKLTAQLNEGTSEALEARDAIIQSLRDEMGEVRTKGARVRDNWQKAFEGMRQHFMQEHGMTSLEALEAVVTLLGDSDVTIDTLHDKKKTGAEGVVAIQRAQGLRS